MGTTYSLLFLFLFFLYTKKSNLETQFFHLHPSLKRVVEFISERIVNNFVRNYKQNIFKAELNDYKDTFINEFGDDNQEELDVRFLIKIFIKIKKILLY